MFARAAIAWLLAGIIHTGLNQFTHLVVFEDFFKENIFAFMNPQPNMAVGLSVVIAGATVGVGLYAWVYRPGYGPKHGALLFAAIAFTKIMAIDGILVNYVGTPMVLLALDVPLHVAIGVVVGAVVGLVYRQPA